jgi:hypothetical protein
MKRFLLHILVCAVALHSLTVDGRCAPSDPPAKLNASEDAELVKRVAGLLKGRTWCHQQHSPVGFVLNYFDFDENTVQINNKYVSDEGTVVMDVLFHGSWSLEALGSNRAKLYFHIVDTSDPDAPKPRDIDLIILENDNLEYNNGDKLYLQEHGPGQLCY